MTTWSSGFTIDRTGTTIVHPETVTVRCAKHGVIRVDDQITARNDCLSAARQRQWRDKALAQFAQRPRLVLPSPG